MKRIIKQVIITFIIIICCMWAVLSTWSTPSASTERNIEYRACIADYFIDTPVPLNASTIDGVSAEAADVCSVYLFNY